MKIDISDTMNLETIVLGYLVKNENYYAFNTLLLVAKSYIFWSFRKELNPNIFQFQKRFYKIYNEQKYISLRNNVYEKFLNKWNYWQTLFDDFVE